MIGENKDDVIGILLAKDLLRYYAGEEEFNVREMLRPAVFIPESKPLNVLLKEFRKNRNHIAIVVDEYGGVAGLVTIEDVIEQIVGDIEDEYDFDDIEDNIVQDKGGQYRVKALTEIADFNARLRHRLQRRRITTRSAGSCMSRFGPRAQARRAGQLSTTSRSRCCAPTAGGCTCSKSAKKKQ